MPILDSLVGYWDLSEASGTRADSSGAGETLTDGNTVTGTTGPGSHNASLFTRANTENLTHANSANLNVFGSDFTIAFWVKLTTITNFQGWAMHGTDTGPSRAWQIYQQDTPATANFVTYQTGGSTVSGSVVATTFGALSTGVWYFVVASRVTATGAMAVSINAGAENTTSSTTFHNTTQTFGFGWRENPTSGHNLNGALAMAGLWKRILTGTERTFLYNGGNGLSYAEMTAPTDNVYNVKQGVILQAVNTGAYF